MKNILMIACLIVIMASCDPDRCTSHYVKNNTSNQIEISFVCDFEGLGNYVIDKGEKQLLGGISCDKAITRLAFYAYDSVIVKVNDIPKIIYKPEKSGKNIYDYEYWVENKKGKRDYEYTFEITDEDIKVEEGL